MHIVYLANSDIPSKTAYSVHVMKMCQAFVSNGQEVTLIVPESPNEVDDIYSYYGVDDSFSIIRVPKSTSPIFNQLVMSLKAARLAKSVEPDLVYGRNMLSCYFTSLFGLQTAYESHGPFDGQPYERIQKYLLSRLTKHRTFHGMVVISGPLKELYENRLPHLENDIYAIHDGADPVSEDVEPIDFKNGDSLKVGYVGSLYEGRGINIIVQLAERCDFATFHIIGGSEKEIAKWRKRTSELENINFHGYIPPADVDKYRISMDVLIAPYQSDLETAGGRNTVDWMSPLKIFEYMAVGKPIVASDFPVIHEILSDQHTALLCDPTDVDQWEDALRKLHDEPSIRDRLGENVKTEFDLLYTWENRADRILSCLEYS